MTREDLITLKENLNQSVSYITTNVFNNKYSFYQVKHRKTMLGYETPEVLEFIQKNKDKLSRGEIDKELSLPKGTTKLLCQLHDINIEKAKTLSYTKEEIEQCKLLYPDKGLKLTAKIMGCSDARIRVLASYLGLKRNYQYSRKEEALIIKDFKHGMKALDLALKYNRSPHAIETFLSRRGLSNSNNVCSPYYVSSTEQYMINYITKALNITVPDKTLKENRSYYWNVVGRYEIDLPLYIDGYKFAIEYDGCRWHEGREESDKRKDQALKKAGFIVLRISSSDHHNNFNDLSSLNEACDKVIETIHYITGSR